MKASKTWEHFTLEIKVTIIYFKKAKTLTSLLESYYWTQGRVRYNTSTRSVLINQQKTSSSKEKNKNLSYDQ